MDHEPPAEDGSTPPAGNHSAALQRPPIGVLGFRSPELERRYLQDEYCRNRPWILGSVTLGLLAALAFYPLDTLFVPPTALKDVHTVRTIAIILPTLVGLIGMAVIRRAVLAIPFAFACLIVVNFAWAAMLWAAGPATELYLAFGIAQTSLFTYSCVALPIRWSMPAVFAALAAFLTLAAGNDLTPRDFWFTTASLVTIAVIATYGTVRYERTTRERFLALERLQTEYALRLSVEHDRAQWLGVIAGFVRHELKNAMAGVVSSLELLERTGLDPERQRYADLARRSLNFMRSVLNRVTTATTLEQALDVQEIEDVDFSLLVRERLADFERGRNMLCQFHIADGVMVRGNADSLAQMLDKLIDNAIDHSVPGEPIVVTLTMREGRARLTIEDFGDPLPADLEHLFHPFITGSDTPDDSHLGLGLYVAQLIVRHHRGSIQAAPANNRPGAVFTVDLPALGH